MALPELANPHQHAAWRRYGWGLVGGVVVTIIGIALGFLWNGSPEPQVLSGGRQLLLENIELGALEQQADPTALNPAMKPKLFYTLQDRLVLRVTAAPAVMEPVTLNARLLTKDGVIVELEPPTITLQPGVSSFCCWQMREVGDFTLQLFRPEKIVTSLPLKVEDVGQGPSLPVF